MNLNFSIGYIAEHYGYKPSLIIAGIFMGLSGCVTIILYILQYLNERKTDTKKRKVVKTNTTIVTSDSLEWDLIKINHSNLCIHWRNLIFSIPQWSWTSNCYLKFFVFLLNILQESLVFNAIIIYIFFFLVAFYCICRICLF